MRDLNKVAEECMKKLDGLGVEYTRPTKWVVNRRAYKRYGQCCRRNGGFEINITYRLLDEIIPVEYLENTIIHELIHTSPGCMNHGEKFQEICRLVNDCYACYNIGTYVNEDEERAVEKYYPKKEKEYKYIVYCPKCSYKWKYQKKTDIVKHPHNYTCSTCKCELELK